MNVLLVDDQVRILEATKKLVDWDSLGIDHVLTAQSAGEARAILESENIDILLTDIEMPEEDGIALQRWQREHFPEVMCIFLTSHADFAYAQEALRNGAYDYILQPAAFPEIEKVMARAIKALAERRDMIETSRNVDAALSNAQKNTLEWSQWIEQGDTQLVRSRVSAMLDEAESRGALSPGYCRRLHYVFMEACRLAAHMLKSDLSNLLADAGEDENALSGACESHRELLDCADRCLRAFDERARRAGNGQEITTEQRIREVIHYLGQNMDRTISRSEAAQQACLNEDYFSRAFKKETGLGYKEYVIEQKMDYAAKLLANTDLPITVVAAKVGYDNYSTFTQMFRKVRGVTPTDYRKATKPGS